MGAGADTLAAAPAGRVLTTKGARTRARIVGAAADLVFERGAGATTLEDVKAASGVSSSQLYHYFADKQALVHAVVDHQAERLVSAQQAADLSTLEGLRAWAEQVVAFERERQGQGGCPLGSLGSELAEVDPRGRAEVAAGFTRWTEAITRGLSAMRAAGRLPATTDPRALATAVLASVQGGLLLSQVQRDVAPLQAALDASVQLVELLAAQASPQGSSQEKAAP